jgi:hypothetical protein
MSNSTAIEKAASDIEKAIAECGVQAITKLPAFIQAVKMANGISAMRAALTEQLVQTVIMPLQGSPLGFLTDKDTTGGYGALVVRDCAIDAMLRGFRVVGNEMNIISGRFYGTKNGYSRVVSELEGLTDLELEPGVPQLVSDKGALVPYVATWRLNGKQMVIRCAQGKDGADMRIPVKVNGGMGADAILGKAERKMLFRIYQRVNGSSFGAIDGEVGDVINTTGEPAPSPVPEGTPDGRRISMRGKRQPAEAAPAPEKTPEPKREDWVNGGASPEDDGRVIT